MSSAEVEAPQRVLLLNGPNLGRLGRRQPEVYGSTTYAEMVDRLVRRGAQLGLEVDPRQSDSDAFMISWLHEAADLDLPVIINPGAWTHYNIAVADAVAQCTNAVIEVHLSNIHAREEFRRHSVISPYATGVIAGLGIEGYELALANIAVRTRRDPAQDRVRRLRPTVTVVETADDEDN